MKVSLIKRRTELKLHDQDNIPSNLNTSRTVKTFYLLSNIDLNYIFIKLF